MNTYLVHFQKNTDREKLEALKKKQSWNLIVGKPVPEMVRRLETVIFPAYGHNYHKRTLLMVSKTFAPQTGKPNTTFRNKMFYYPPKQGCPGNDCDVMPYVGFWDIAQNKTKAWAAKLNLLPADGIRYTDADFRAKVAAIAGGRNVTPVVTKRLEIIADLYARFYLSNFVFRGSAHAGNLLIGALCKAAGLPRRPFRRSLQADLELVLSVAEHNSLNKFIKAFPDFFVKMAKDVDEYLPGWDDTPFTYPASMIT
jgi:hypothetical protein